MAVQVKHTVVVLWEHEIRAAAKALKQVRDDLNKFHATPPATEEEKTAAGEVIREAMWNAIDAAGAALVGAENDGDALVISSVPKPAGKKRDK